MPQVSWNAMPVYAYAHCAAVATTLVKTGGGCLHYLIFNSTGVGTVTVYDSLTATGQVIAVITAPAAGLSMLYDITFNTGLTVVTTSGIDVTASYD